MIFPSKKVPFSKEIEFIKDKELKNKAKILTPMMPMEVWPSISTGLGL